MEHIIEPADKFDAIAIAHRLRPEDLMEVMAATGRHPSDVLPSCVDTSTLVWRVVPGPGQYPRYVALFGANPHPSDPLIGVPWMVATRELQDHQKFFLRRCKSYIEDWLTRWPILTNCVDARNELHIKWLRWSGFNFTKLHPAWGYEKRPFWQFERRSHHV